MPEKGWKICPNCVRETLPAPKGDPNNPTICQNPECKAIVQEDQIIGFDSEEGPKVIKSLELSVGDQNQAMKDKVE